MGGGGALKRILFIMLFFALVIGFFLYVNLTATQEHEVFAADEGVFDLRAFDFAQGIAMLRPDTVDQYADVLLTPSDFLGSPDLAEYASLPEKTQEHIPSGFGTYHFSLLLPKNTPMALSFINFNFAYRVYAGDDLLLLGGTLSADESENVAIARPYQVDLPACDGVHPLEITLQYANFARPLVGMALLSVSTTEMATQRARSGIFAACLVAGLMLCAAIMYLGMYLSYQRKTQYLAFALCCLSVSVYTLIAFDMAISVLFVSPSAILIARVEYICFTLAATSLLLYLDAVFGSVSGRLYKATFLFMNALCIFVFLFTPPAFFTEYRTPYMAFIAVYSVALTVKIVRGGSKLDKSQALVLAGMALMGIAFVLEAFVIQWDHELSKSALLQSGIMLFVLINMVAMAMSVQRLETALAVSKQQEEALAALNEQLHHVNQLKSGFLTTMSHELKTPLTIISGYAQLTAKKLRQGIIDEKMIERQALMEKETNRLALLVSQLLVSSVKKQNSKECGGCDLKSVLSEVALLFEPLMLRKQNTIALTLPKEKLSLHIEENALTQVLVNLLANANRHTHKGIIQIQARREQGMAIITVLDTGSGFAPSVLPHVFEQFASTHADESTAGFGLFICREIITKHGGTITAENRNECGAEVVFGLPIAREREVQRNV